MFVEQLQRRQWQLQMKVAFGGGQAGLRLLVGGHFTSLFIAAYARLASDFSIFLLKILTTPCPVSCDSQVGPVSRRRNLTFF
jgi:hypothetical protein